MSSNNGTVGVRRFHELFCEIAGSDLTKLWLCEQYLIFLKGSCKQDIIL